MTYILAFWPHPDDIDLGAGGTLYKTAQQGRSNIIIDLTPSQLSSNWNPKLRMQEAQVSAKILWVPQRLNLELEDLAIQDDTHHRQIIAYQIRKRKPEIVMLPNFSDRHPDHEASAKLIKSSIFIAWLAKIDISWLQPHRPRLALEYMIRDDFKPDLIIWLSQEEYAMKMKAYEQFHSQQETNQRADNYILGRSMKLGWEIGKTYGEWFRIVNGTIWLDNFDSVTTRAF